MPSSHVLRIDRIACDGHGMCAELLPELIELDEWGYPVLPSPDVSGRLLRHARRAVGACPVLAMRLEPRSASRSERRGGTTERPNE